MAILDFKLIISFKSFEPFACNFGNSVSFQDGVFVHFTFKTCERAVDPLLELQMKKKYF